MKRIKDWFVKYWNIAVTVGRNIAELADAVALAGVSGFAIHQALQANHVQSYWYRSLLCGGVLIALKAFWLLVKHFNHPVAEVKK
jgi:hypothetical protein